MQVFKIHFSDGLQKYDNPVLVYQGDENLGMPFVYFTAEDPKRAVEIVRQLPNIYDLHNIPTLYKTMEELRTHIFLGYFPSLPDYRFRGE
jgi:hypothetical protein